MVIIIITIRVQCIDCYKLIILQSCRLRVSFFDLLFFLLLRRFRIKFTPYVYIHIYVYNRAYNAQVWTYDFQFSTSNTSMYSNLNPPVVPAKCNCVSITTFRRIDFGIKYQIVGFICFFPQFLFHPTAFRSICRSETFKRKINLTIFKNQINLSGEI